MIRVLKIILMCIFMGFKVLFISLERLNSATCSCPLCNGGGAGGFLYPEERAGFMVIHCGGGGVKGQRRYRTRLDSVGAESLSWCCSVRQPGASVSMAVDALQTIYISMLWWKRTCRCFVSLAQLRLACMEER